MVCRSLNPPVVLVLTGLLLSALSCQRKESSSSGGARGPSTTNAAVPVIAGTVQTKDVPIYLEGLGTVQAFNTVLVRSRVDGQIQRIAFQEGQEVRAGDLLAQIDPAPFQAQLDQSISKKAADEAQLQVARITLARDADLLASKILSQQDYDTQKALVDQLQAAVKADDGAIDNARTQLGYTTITSPLEGRTGIRMVDQGNIVHATDSTGIVTITQLRPISVVFTLPETSLPQIQRHLNATNGLLAYALERDNRSVLADGKLAVIDNQIDITTGTIRLKATFENKELRLWPGQFVNVRLLLEVRNGATVVPASVVQRGPDGTFAFVIESDRRARVRPVKVGQIELGQALIEEGLVPGEQVVVDGQYKLQPGALVKIAEATGEGGTTNRPTSVTEKIGSIGPAM
jgi:multidrug efflux system membrane fusion protein